jgi:transcriptional regulator with XRE-family HTH domain
MGKHESYIAQWRAFRGLKQREVIERLAELQAENPSEKFPTTEASLSRVENGTQNFSMRLLGALAHVLGAERPGDLLNVNPFKGTLSAIHALERLTDVQREAALKVLEAMFPPPAPSAEPASGES